jgi:pilus assembly protein CpaF
MTPDLIAIRALAHRRLLDRAQPGDVIDATNVSSLVDEIAPLLDRQSAMSVVTAILADVNGLGPLERVLNDPEVSDVMVVGGRGVWIERAGVVSLTSLKLSDEEVFHLIEKIVGPLGLRIDRSSPIVDARLGDGSRVNAVIPPLAVDGPCLTIRRFGARRIELSDFAGTEVAALLASLVRDKRNIVVSGGTGAGKTTLLNALASTIPAHERLITIEDAAELRLPLPHVVRLEARPPNSEGVGQVSLRDLVRNALRMRPDRIIVGEVRGPEALDMLQAMNTGHEGSISTCHANSPIDALSRIETMVLTGAVSLPLAAIRQQILSSIDVVIQVSRTSSALRKVVDVAEVYGSHGELSVRSLIDGERVVSELNRPGRKAA